MSVDSKAGAEHRAPERAGDCVLPLSEAACSDLVNAHGPMVKAACRRILGDESLAEDAAQEVFLLLVRKLPSLSPRTLLGGWLYLAACRVARTHGRTLARRREREHRAEVMENLMNPSQDTLWRDLEPLLDDAMMTLSGRQRELVLARYFRNSSQRDAAGLVGCSESVASRELAAAIERLRRFFNRHGVALSGSALVALLSAHGAQASIGATAMASTLSSASTLAAAAPAGGSLVLALMKTTTTTKIAVAVAAALLITTGTVHYLTREPAPASRPQSGMGPTSAPVRPAAASPAPGATPALTPRPAARAGGPPPGAGEARSPRKYDAATLKAAREKQEKFWKRIDQFALMGDPARVQELLLGEYGIRLSVDEVRELQARGQKGFRFGVVERWASRQPQEALAWAATALSDPGVGAGDFHQLFIDAARRNLPDFSRDTLAALLPEGPARDRMLDLAEASADPYGLARRILAATDADAEDRAARLRILAQGWANAEAAADWARQNLSGPDRTAFYAQVGYNLAHVNPQAALQVLAELQGTDAYASTFSSMMRGLVQTGGLGRQAADLIAGANLNPQDRAELVSELSRRWVRQDPDAAIAWANSLAAPEDFRAAIPLLVSQLDNDRVSRTVEAFLKNRDPVMELALLEAAAPPGLYFDPEKSRLILDPLIAREPDLKISVVEGDGTSREARLWSSVNQTARRQAEVGQPAAAMDWLATLPFASPDDYARAAAGVYSVWTLKSEADASQWLQNSTLSAAARANVVKLAQQ